MKTKLLLLLASFLALAAPPIISAQPTAFTYSGQLNFAGAAANGMFDFQFSLISVPPADMPVDRFTNGVPVSNGLFTVTLDFGAVLLDGRNLVLEIGVRSNNLAIPYTLLQPPQPVLSVPYAVRALTAGSATSAQNVTGVLTDSSIPQNIPRLDASRWEFPGAAWLNNTSNLFSGDFSGTGSSLRNVRLSTADSGGAFTLNNPLGATFSSAFVVPEIFDLIDWNGDGHMDLLASVSTAQGFDCVVLTNDARGAYAPASVVYSSTAGGVPGTEKVKVADVNGDPWPDILLIRRATISQSNHILDVLTNSGLGTFQFALTNASIDAPQFSLADLDGDGLMDLWLPNNSTYINNLDGHIWEAVEVEGLTNYTTNFAFIASTSLPLCPLTLDDISRDAHPDLIAWQCPGVISLKIMTNRAGVFDPNPLHTLTLALTAKPFQAKVQDFNGDRCPDILVTHEEIFFQWVTVINNGTVTNSLSYRTFSLLTNDGLTSFRLACSNVSPATNCVYSIVFDVNRDGLPDILASTSSRPESPLQVAWPAGLYAILNNGRGGFGEPIRIGPFVPAQEDWAIADANGDGQEDFLVPGFGILYLDPARLEFRSAPTFASTSGPPFTVSSTARVDRLNVDLLDGFDSAAFVLKSGDTMTGPLVAPSFSGDGSALTALNANQLTAGTLADARLSSNIARRGGVNTFTASNIFNGVLTATNNSNSFAGTFTGNGGALTNLNAAGIAGTIPDGRLSPNVSLLNSNQTITGTKLFAPPAGAPFGVGNTNRVANLNADLLDGWDSSAFVLKAGDTMTGPLAALSFSGDGSALTGLNAANLTTGTILSARLPANVSLLDANQTVTGLKNFAPASGPPFSVGSTNRVVSLNADLIDGLDASAFVLRTGDTLSGPLTASAFSGDGSGLTGLNAANVSTGLLPLTRGGTGASTPANARANINAAIRGANSDITSLSGLTTPLSISQGGSGANDPTNALKNFGGAALAGLNVFPGTNHLTNAANVLAGDGSRITGLAPAALSAPVAANRGGLGFDSSGTAAGSLLQATGGGAWSALPPGTDGQVLKINGTTPAWAEDAVNTYTAGSGLSLTGSVFNVRFAGSGIEDTAARSDHQHDATNLVSGLLPDARLAPNVARLNVSQTFTASTLLGSGAQLLSDAGSAAAPGLSFNGDADTGWFRPAANSVALATAGAERMRVDASGNVGVGTSTPTAQLEVNGSLKATSFIGSGAGLTGLNPTNLGAGVVPAAVTFANAANTFTGTFSGDGSGLAGLNALNLTGPFTVSSEIFRTGTYNSGGAATGVTISSNLAFVAMYSSGLFILDISDESNPRLVGSYNSPGLALSVAVSGRYAYLADESAGVQVIDVIDPASPVRVGGFNTPGKAYDVAVSGNYVFIADESTGLLIIDVTNPAIPSYVGGYNTSGLALGVALSTHYACVADHTGGLQIIDVNDPANPVRVGGYVTTGGARGVAVSGRYAYVADPLGGLEILDINNPASPQRVGGSATLGPAMGVALSNDRAYVVCDNNGLTSGLSVIDISNPSSPTLVTNFLTGGNPAGVAANGPYAFVAAGFEGLQVLTTGTATAPRFAGNGSGLTGLDASKITIGTLSDNRLSANVARLDVSQTFTASKSFAPGVRLLLDGSANSAPSLAFSGDLGTGLYQPSPGQLAVSTVGQERLRVDGSGKVGIGLTAPEVTLDVHAPLNVNASMRLTSGGSWGLVLNQSPSSLFTVTNGGQGRLAIESGGNVGIGTNAPTQKLHVVGNILATGTITPNSDRNAKTSFASVDPAAVLEKVTQLSIQEWRFKNEPEQVKHLGPMAQDFRSAFGLGEIPTAIATVDADGVALAAIQGLNQKLTEELKRRDAENAELKSRLERLERKFLAGAKD